MMDRLHELATNPRVKQLSDVRNIGLYIFGFMVVAITWSGAKTIQTNYGLQKKISTLKQQNEVSQLENDNLKLKNKFLQTDEFLDMAARRQFGKAAPGEKVYVVPKSVAESYTIPPVIKPEADNYNDEPSGSKIQQNLSAWKDFLLGRHSPKN